MSYYLHRNGEQVGPYDKDSILAWVADGSVRSDESIWTEGFSEWLTVSQAFGLPAAPPAIVQQASPPPPLPQQTVVHVHNSRKQGSLLGGWICFVIGCLTMIVTACTFVPIYAVLFFVSFVLSIVAMTQGKALGGILLLIANLTVPGIIAFLWLVVFAAASSA